MTVRAAAALALAVLAMTHATAQAPQFRSGTALVVVDVVATRADGGIARDLKAGDFEIFEDGRPQSIKTFQFVDLETPPAVEKPADVFTNTQEPGAIFAIVLDDLKVDPAHTGAMRRWAHRFIDDQVRPHDRAAVLLTGRDSGLILTGDRRFLNGIVEQAMGRRSRSDLAGLATAAEATEAGLGDSLGVMTARETAATLEMLQRIVERFGEIQARRKAILWFSQGVSIEIDAISAADGSGNNNDRAADALRALLAAARASNVAIYGVDPRGLAGNEDIGALSPSAADGDTGGLRDIATATGGRPVVNTNGLARAFDGIARENRAYYLLGYEPADPDTTRRRARRLDVRTRAAGVTLLHRRAYVPSDPSAAASREGTIGSLLPSGDLAVALSPSVIVDPKGALGVAVPFEIGTGLPDGTAVRFTLAALRENGKPEGKAQTGTLRVAGGGASDRALLRLEEGRYQLRLAAEEVGGARRGVAFATVTVPRGGADAAVCGGIALFAGGQTMRANVSRQVRTGDRLAGLVTLAARNVDGATLAVSIGQRGHTPARMIAMGAPTEVKKGYWNVEFTIAPPLPPGAIDLTVLANGQALCGTTIVVSG